MNPAHGGPSQGIRNSIPALAALGQQHEVVCFDAPNEPFLIDQGFVIHALGSARTSLAYQPTFYTWLTTHAKHYDAIVVHGIWQYHSYAVRKYARAAKRKGIKVPRVYIMPHGMLDPWFQQAPERRWKALRNEWYWRLIERDNINQADGLFFTCQAELELARTTFRGYKPKAQYNIGYGIPAPPAYIPDMDQAFQQRCTGLGKKPYLLFLSRIHSKKGLELLLAAYGAILSTTADPNDFPHLVVVGPGAETAYGQKCLALIAANGLLKQHVHIAGMLSGDAKWSALYGTEAFVLPSHQENFGIAVVEAMACGKPVLISNKVNIYREIESEGAGIIGSDDLDGVKAQLMQWFKMSNTERLNMGNAARATYEKHFTVEAAAKQLISAIQV